MHDINYVRHFSARTRQDNVEPDARTDIVLFSLYPPEASLKSPYNSKRSSFSAFDANKSEEQILCRPVFTEAESPYNVFSKWQKRIIVVIIGVAGFFSGLSSNIYFPALDVIAQDLNVSKNQVNLTISSYLVVQAIAPWLWGSLADTIGRRPIYLCSFAVYIAANIALSYSPNYTVVLVFRAIQAAGSAATVSIGTGVIQDITPPAERGGFVAFYQCIRNFSIAGGPVLGGILAMYLGFRSIFVSLLILSSVVLIVIVLFLPETHRKIAGNGSIQLKGIYKPLIEYFTHARHCWTNSRDSEGRDKVTARTFWEPLLLLIQGDILLSLLFGGVIYAIWTMVTTSTTPLFKSAFNLNEVLIGLAYIPNGLGTICGSLVAGRLMDWAFASAKKEYEERQNIPCKLSTKNLPLDFPIERVRTGHVWWITTTFILTVCAYGFSLNSAVVSRRGWIAVPLVLQFVIAATSNAIFAINQTLVADLCPGKGASSTAMNNMVRCSLGAMGTAVIEKMLQGMGVWQTFLALGLVGLCVMPLSAVHWCYGQKWRMERVLKKENAGRAAQLSKQ